MRKPDFCQSENTDQLCGNRNLELVSKSVMCVSGTIRDLTRLRTVMCFSSDESSIKNEPIMRGPELCNDKYHYAHMISVIIKQLYCPLQRQSPVPRLKVLYLC